jgi:CubicO group peptidase (beta-lactamase class C family)
MKRNFIALALCLVLTNLCFAQGAGQKAFIEDSGPISPAKIKKIEAAITAWMSQTKAPALSVAIVMNDELRLAKGYGLADLENKVPARSDSVYRLASISKSITAIAVMQLVERGKIDLNAPIHKYCAAYPETEKLKDAPEKKFSITVRQLLVHQAGVRHNTLDETRSTKYYENITQAIGSFKDDPLVAEPGTKYSYSTPGYTLLGCAIEGATGQSYVDYVRENVFRPAGMTRTFVDDVYAVIPNRVRGYMKDEGQIWNTFLHDTSIKIPGGGLVSSAEDLAKFAIAVNTNKLVTPETLAQMWTRPKTSDGKEQNYAMGFMINDENGVMRVTNDGGQAGTRTFLFLLPKQKFAIALMTNLQLATCEELVPKIIDVLSEKEKLSSKRPVR